MLQRCRYVLLRQYRPPASELQVGAIVSEVDCSHSHQVRQGGLRVGVCSD